MADKTGIQWTDATWNPIRGCEPYSPGCAHCYAANVAARFSQPTEKFPNPPYAGLAVKTPHGGRWTGELLQVEDHLDQPLRWQKPRRIFVNSMSDLFWDKVPFDYIDRVFAVMALARRHTFQVLTKRPERMYEYFQSGAKELMDRWGDACRAEPTWARYREEAIGASWPLPNVWLGTSVESQEFLDPRLSHLARTPAAVRFVSAEPLLGPLMFNHDFNKGATAGLRRHWLDPDGAVNWLIVGGESQKGARPMDPEWVRSLRDQCVNAGVPFFFKQWGGHPNTHARELDGRTWDEFPEDKA